MTSSNPSPSNTTAKSKANADVQSEWASNDERVVEWLAPQHSEGPRSDGRATFVVSVSVGRGTDPKNPKNFGLCTQTQSRFCGGASGCSLEEEPALGSFPVLADICRGFQEDMLGASEDPEEKTAEQRGNDRVDGTDGGTGSDTSARSAHSRLALPDYLSKYFMSPAIRKLRAEPGGMETYSKAVDLDVDSLEKLALVSSLALAEGVSHVYRHWLKEDHYDLTDESRLVRIGAISDAEMQRLCASPSTEPWSFSSEFSTGNGELPLLTSQHYSRRSHFRERRPPLMQAASPAWQALRARPKPQRTTRLLDRRPLPEEAATTASICRRKNLVYVKPGGSVGMNRTARALPGLHE